MEALRVVVGARPQASRETSESREMRLKSAAKVPDSIYRRNRLSGAPPGAVLPPVATLFGGFVGGSIRELTRPPADGGRGGPPAAQPRSRQSRGPRPSSSPA